MQKLLKPALLALGLALLPFLSQTIIDPPAWAEPRIEYDTDKIFCMGGPRFDFAQEVYKSGLSDDLVVVEGEELQRIEDNALHSPYKLKPLNADRLYLLPYVHKEGVDGVPGYNVFVERDKCIVNFFTFPKEIMDQLRSELPDWTGHPRFQTEGGENILPQPDYELNRPNSPWYDGKRIEFAAFDRVEAVVLVQRREDNHHGSGVLLSPTKVLTAHHVVSPHLQIMTDDGRVYGVVSARRLRTDLDVSVLTLNRPVENVVPAKYSCDLPEVGSTLIHVGNPSVLRNVVVPWFVSGYEPGGDRSAIVAGITVGGSSGGPAYNEKNEVVGIAVRKLAFLWPVPEVYPRGIETPSGFGAFTPVHHFCNELEAYLGEESSVPVS